MIYPGFNIASKGKNCNEDAAVTEPIAGADTVQCL